MSDEPGNLPAKRDDQPPDLRVLVELVSKALELETTRVAASTRVPGTPTSVQNT